MSENLLIQFKTNWADEIEICGFHVVSSKAWWFFKKTLNEIEFPYTLGVGSNQEITYESQEKFLECFNVQPISGVVATIIASRFKLPFGEFPIEQIFTGIIEEEPERGIQNETWLMKEILPDYPPIIP